MAAEPNGLSGAGDHTRIVDNFCSLLNRDCGVGSPCDAYGSDRKVRVPRTTSDGARDPDATVTCSANDHGKPLIIASPVVILEVASYSPEPLDTVKKPREFTVLPKLVQYVLVDSRERWALSCVRRNGTWDSDCSMDEIVTIPRFGSRLSFAELYAGSRSANRKRRSYLATDNSARTALAMKAMSADSATLSFQSERERGT